MTKDEAMRLIGELESAAISSYEFINGITRRGKLETRERREHKAIRAILKHLTDEKLTDEEIRNAIY